MGGIMASEKLNKVFENYGATVSEGYNNYSVGATEEVIEALYESEMMNKKLQKRIEFLEETSLSSLEYNRLLEIDKKYEFYKTVEQSIIESKKTIENQMNSIEKEKVIIKNILDDYNQLLEQKKYKNANEQELFDKTLKGNIDQFNNLLNSSESKFNTLTTNKINEIKKLFDSIDEKRLSLQQLIQNSDNQMKELIETSKEKSDENIKNIEDQCLELLSKTKNTTLSKDFSNRAEEISKRNNFYLIGAIGAIITLAIVSTFVLEFDTDRIFSIKNIRSLMISMLFVSVGILLPAKEFLKGKKLEEDYVFKGMIAGTMDDYRNLINGNSKIDSHGLDILKKAIEQLYKDPTYEDKDTTYEKLINKISKNLDRNITLKTSKDGVELEVSQK